MRGYRRSGESGLSDTQVFFVAGLVACCGQEMRRIPRVEAVRRVAVQPVQIQAFCLRNRQGFTRAGAACEAVRIVLAQPVQVDSGGTTDRLLQRIWWPVVRSCGRQANRELRCDSGTAPPLYLGDFPPTGMRDRLFSGHCDRNGETVRFARRHAAGRARESEDLPAFTRSACRLRGRLHGHGLRVQAVELSDIGLSVMCRASVPLRGVLRGDCAGETAWRL